MSYNFISVSVPIRECHPLAPFLQFCRFYSQLACKQNLHKAFLLSLQGGEMATVELDFPVGCSEDGGDGGLFDRRRQVQLNFGKFIPPQATAPVN
jgi:hypothetical protein